MTLERVRSCWERTDEGRSWRLLSSPRCRETSLSRRVRTKAMTRTATILGTWCRRKSNASSPQSLSTSMNRCGTQMAPKASLTAGIIIVGAIIATGCECADNAERSSKLLGESRTTQHSQICHHVRRSYEFGFSLAKNVEVRVGRSAGDFGAPRGQRAGAGCRSYPDARYHYTWPSAAARGRGPVDP